MRLVLMFCLLVVGSNTPTNAACTLLDWSDCADNFVGQVTHVSVTFHNHTNWPYLVVMDNNRESYVVAARGSATFRSARIGDNPTLHIRDPNTNQEFDSWTVGVLSGDMDLDYN